MIIFQVFSPLGAVEVSIEARPQNPVMGQPFDLIFSIQTDSTEHPFISFNPAGARVLGRESRGVNISTTMIGGQFTTVRRLSYAYQLMPEAVGPISIRNIEVSVGDKATSLNDLQLNVLAQAPTPREIFLKADVSDLQAYIGQGIDVRYYLYYRTSITGREIEVFPKLDNFIKRFHMPGRDSVDTVEYQGRLYRRMYIYGARLFPQVTGRLYVDPMTVKVQYTRESTGSSPFGIRSREYATTSVESRTITIEVKELPSENVPASFQGLVGEHTFSLSSFHDRHLVNEPIEFTLTVEGEGALESFPAPRLYDSPYLEEFDRQSEMQDISFARARKTFNYVYLGRAPGEVKDQSFSYSYFDLDKNEYIERTVELRDLVIGGSAGRTARDETHSDAVAGVDRELPRENLRRGPIPPTFTKVGVEISKGIRFAFGVALAVILLLILYKDFGHYLWLKDKRGLIKGKLGQMRKRGVDYHQLSQLFFEIGDELNLLGGPKEIINKMTLSDEAKKYFIELIEVLEGGSFADNYEKGKIGLDKKYAKELLKVI